MSSGEQYQGKKIKNWSEYNRSLKARGSLTLWFEGSMEDWWYSDPKQTPKRGRGLHKTFSDQALQLCLMVRLAYKLPYRQLEGFIESMFKLLKLPLSTPDATIYSKQRGKSLAIALPRRLPEGAVNIAVDSTGIKVYGEGEWKVRKHGVGKRRTWRKLHLAIDVNSHEIVAAELTDEGVTDGEVFGDLLDQLEDHPIDTVYGDGAYDQHDCYDACAEAGAKAIIPPRKNAALWQGDHPRNAAVTQCSTANGRKQWKRASGYHTRSLVETAMYRYKAIIGPAFRARLFETQQVEAHAAIALLNRFRALGMPQRA
jgi:hypothetical protein